MKFLLFLLIPVYKYLINSYRLKRIEELYKYFQNIKTKSYNKKVFETKSETLELFKIAKINDVFIHVSENVGNEIRNSIISVLNNYPNQDKDLYICQNNIFLETIGVFKKRKMEAYSLIYWLETFIFLPQNLLNYFNFSSSSVLSKVFNCIYWVLSFLLGLFHKEIKDFILKIIQNFS